ncbi:EamA family transporter RarD [Stakelama sediminis]|uniref:Chloramphenicol-sensitive protein RarD n=1 Tax=Stakelama sediminis TaxID=463200 RepID=A0A840YUZ7_9SPHN|nr:EamA family transporter RarD [Stakelama sediminis]MBB5717364.1 chloramphenicol-sensitive protein RarD [Stakelama sediminis]
MTRLPAPEPIIVRDTRGLLQGVGAYLIWGLLPIFLGLIAQVDGLEIIANRILWALAILLVVGPALGRTAKLRAALGNPRLMATLMISALLIGANWTGYVWAVLHQHVLAASLGYFLNPLINVLLGTMLLGERLDRVQGIAVALAAAGVAILAAEAPDALWVSLLLAFSFAFYGYVRKRAPVEPIEGLTVETLLLALPAFGYLVWLGEQGSLSFGSDVKTTLLLMTMGPLTVTPLLLFAAAARRLRLTTLGLLQYIAPSLQFLIAVTLFHEPLSMPHLACFVLIWAGLVLFALHSIRLARRPVLVPAR